MSQWALKVDNLSKRFESDQAVQALNDVSFQLNKGNILGLIGNNGAGKSTLLKIMSGLIKPDKGTVSFRGRLASILDIGSGFHPDLSGFDNIYLAGRLIGLTDKQIRRSVDEIIAFSELQNFIHTPLKYYSSGMFLRLAFTTSTSFNSDILLLDEVIAVGDRHFQEKSKERILQIVKSGSTVIVAGHNIETLSNLCTHGLWLTAGKQTFFGEINEAIDKYLTYTSLTAPDSVLPLADATIIIDQPSPQPEQEENDSGGVQSPEEATKEIIPEETTINYRQHVVAQDSDAADKPIVLLEAGVRMKGKAFQEDIYMDNELEIVIRYQKKIVAPVMLFVVIQDKFGANLLSAGDHRLINTEDFMVNDSEGVFCQTATIPAFFFNHGIFSVNFYFTDAEQNDVAVLNKVLFFRILKSEYRFNIFTHKGKFMGALLPAFKWGFQKEG